MGRHAGTSLAFTLRACGQGTISCDVEAICNKPALPCTFR